VSVARVKANPTWLLAVATYDSIALRDVVADYGLLGFLKSFGRVSVRMNQQKLVRVGVTVKQNPAQRTILVE
jgi:hypothetical protein